MIRKIGLIGILMAILSLPLAAYGQDLVALRTSILRISVITLL